MTVELPESLRRPIDCLMIDNFDSFTWNVYQSLTLLGTDVTVIRNDAIPVSAFPSLDVRCLIISPGPGHPLTDSGISRDAIRYFTGKIPILGVCMGLECIVDVFGGTIGYAGEIMHGKLSHIRHDGRGCFNGLPQGFKSTRYHSLSASIKTLPEDLAITAMAEESGVIMGVRHRKYTVESVQYHPESILSEAGDDLLKNFLSLKGGTWEKNTHVRVLDVSLPPFPIESPNGKPASSLPTILEKIYAQRLKDVEAAKSTPGTTPADIDTLLAMHLSPPLIPLVDRMRTTPQTTPALMAEIKRASPSKGPIAMSTNAAQQALTYALSGASVISVLTEPTWFKGSLLDMRLARQAIDALPNRPAVLRKDFILDEYQIAEARLHGADTVLLIVAMLPVYRLEALYAYSISLGMEPLVEVNNAAEMEQALALGAKVIGVNNRNLHDFNVDMGTTSRLAEMVKEKDVILCALSGISNNEDVQTYVQQGVRAVLVGEALMRAKDTGAFIQQLLGWPSQKKREDEHARTPLVKICGIRTEKEALEAMDAGADMLGLMFVPTSKRHISLEQARTISVAVRNTRASNPIPPNSVDGDEPEVNEPWFTAHAHRLSASPTRPLLVGVFQNQPLSFILNAVSAAQLDIVQLHGSEPAQLPVHIPIPVIRVFHVGKDGAGIEEITRPGLHDFVLLDSMRPQDGLSGGSGQVVDWEVAKEVVERGEVYRAASVSIANAPLKDAHSDANVSATAANGSANGETAATTKVAEAKQPAGGWLPIILAGGLTLENVRQAITLVKPWAVDVSGGVEMKDGAGKDVEKVRAFVRAAKGLEDIPVPVVEHAQDGHEDKFNIVAIRADADHAV
ncbi:N-anthranilate isomerase [Rickenella mellea]|uniref:Multifunctional tryptophan biosynthesis protein n=1 Tax=Rickenella mellea TaxID=50990 RepID=A0A4Y7PYE7_9AGAM|nr:N-anthranilate isomerase [Rickenella mellea]